MFWLGTKHFTHTFRHTSVTHTVFAVPPKQPWRILIDLSLIHQEFMIYAHENKTRNIMINRRSQWHLFSFAAISTLVIFIGLYQMVNRANVERRCHLILWNDRNMHGCVSVWERLGRYEWLIELSLSIKVIGTRNALIRNCIYICDENRWCIMKVFRTNIRFYLLKYVLCL